MELKIGSILHCIRGDGGRVDIEISEIARATTPNAEDQVVLSIYAEGVYTVVSLKWLRTSLETTKHVRLDTLLGEMRYHILSVTVDAETHINFNIH